MWCAVWAGHCLFEFLWGVFARLTECQRRTPRFGPPPRRRGVWAGKSRVRRALFGQEVSSGSSAGPGVVGRSCRQVPGVLCIVKGMGTRGLLLDLVGVGLHGVSCV